jgi:hypothetical protein
VPAAVAQAFIPTKRRPSTAVVLVAWECRTWLDAASTPGSYTAEITTTSTLRPGSMRLLSFTPFILRRLDIQHHVKWLLRNPAPGGHWLLKPGDPGTFPCAAKNAIVRIIHDQDHPIFRICFIHLPCCKEVVFWGGAGTAPFIE